MNKHIVVIGGGMAGTAAASELVNHGYDVTIAEQNDYLGGRMHTHMVEGAAIEMGACFTTNFYDNLLKFMADNGMSDRLYEQHKLSGIWRNGRVWTADLKTLVGNNALSWRAKLQLAPMLLSNLPRWRNLDHHAFWKSAPYDNRSVAEALADKDELLEYLFQPGLNGYLYWTPEHTSEALLACGLKAALIWRNTYRVRGGLQRIPETAAEGSTVMLGCTVRSVVASSDGSFEVTMERGGQTELLRADGIVCATTASAPLRIFELTSKQKSFFEAIQYSSTAVLARTYPSEHTCNPVGIAFPRKEGVELAAVTLDREPTEGGALANLRTYASGTIGKQLCAESDEVITRELTQAMESVRQNVLADDADPVTTHVQRWPEALPFFDVGHMKRLQEFEQGGIEDQGQPVVFAGDYLGGPFMEGAYTSGVQAAVRLDERLRQLTGIPDESH